MSIKVYHSKIPNFSGTPTIVATRLAYQHVATVDTSDENKAWELTQNEYRRCHDTTGIVDHHIPNHRSTSVGDILELDNGQLLEVRNVGFSIVVGGWA